MVKYADSPTTSIAVEIDAAPATVWPLLCDINLPGRFSDEFQRAVETAVTNVLAQLNDPGATALPPAA